MSIELYLDTITIKSASVASKVRLASEAGFAGPRIRGNDLREWEQGGGTAESLASLLLETNQKTPGFVAEADTYQWHFLDPNAPDLSAALDWTFASARTLGASIVLLPVMSTEGSLDQTAANLRSLCERAQVYGVNVGLEFIGHIPKVPDLRTAWRVVEQADHPNGGLVIDFFHFYRGGTELADLKEVPVGKILMVDLADAMPLPREELLGYKHRLYPGEGVVGATALLAALIEQGFNGPLAVELFNEDYWATDPADVAAHAYRASRGVLESAQSSLV